MATQNNVHIPDDLLSAVNAVAEFSRLTEPFASARTANWSAT